MRDRDTGLPMISTHMMVGNFKENLRIVVNGGDKSLIKSKVAVGETMALVVKPVEKFWVASSDIMRDEDGDRDLCIRPITFEVMGKRTTAIAMSEQLPEDTIFTGTLRVVAGSVLDDPDTLKYLLDLGKNNGLGSWRGSGNKGAFNYKLEHLPGYKEVFADGWE